MTTPRVLMAVALVFLFAAEGSHQVFAAACQVDSAYQQPPDGGSYVPAWDPVVSGDGRYVAFSYARGDVNIFVKDRQSGTIEGASVPQPPPVSDRGRASSSNADISADGRYVVFVSYATDLVEGDTNNNEDVYLRDRQTGAVERISIAADGTQADGSSGTPSISPDGRFVAFYSRATTLVPWNGPAPQRQAFSEDYDLYLKDRQTGAVERLNVTTDGAPADRGESMIGAQKVSISADGRYVAFTSWASNLVANDTNGTGDVFVKDRQTGALERISAVADPAQARLVATSKTPTITPDGRFVAFTSEANLVPSLVGRPLLPMNVFVKDLQTGAIDLVSATADGITSDGHSLHGFISADGRYVVFDSHSKPLTPDGDGETQVFVKDRQTGTLEVVSTAPDGAPGDHGSAASGITADGRYVLLRSAATNFVPGSTPPREGDIYVKDRQTGTIERATVVSESKQGFQHAPACQSPAA